MELSKIINQNSHSDIVSIANVSVAEAGEFSAVSFCQERNPSVFAPYGISFIPPVGAQALLLNTDGNNICMGTLSDYSDLNPGELKLCSSAGAKILLKNNGDIVLNGVVITANGEIIPPQQ